MAAATGPLQPSTQSPGPAALLLLGTDTERALDRRRQTAAATSHREPQQEQTGSVYSRHQQICFFLMDFSTSASLFFSFLCSSACPAPCERAALARGRMEPAGGCCPWAASSLHPPPKAILAQTHFPPSQRLPPRGAGGGVTGSFSCCLFCPVRLFSPGSLLPFTRAPFSALLSLLRKASAHSAPPSPLAAPTLLFLVLTSCCCPPGALLVSPSSSCTPLHTAVPGQRPVCAAGAWFS